MAPRAATLSDRQIAALVQSAGFSPNRQHRGAREDAVAVAVVLAESRGNTMAHNSTPPDDSYGLFQINLYGNLRADRMKRYNLQRPEDLYLPSKNAQVAFDIFRQAGNRFTPWSVWLNGSYLAYLPRGLAAVKDPDPTGVDSIELLPPAFDNPLAPIAELVTFATDPQNWLRVAMFVGGGLVLIVGVILFVADSGAAPVPAPVRKAARVARKVT